MSGELLRAALRYAARGWPVFPCAPGAKVPNGHLVRHGVKQASTDPEQITAWWARCPTANVAIATGDPGPDVIDFDVTGGKPGPATYRRLRDAGLLVGAHLVVATPSGGRHLYFAGTGQGNGAMARHGVDFRSRGGYVLAPPSVIGGRPYTVAEEVPQTGVMADFGAVRRMLEPPRPAASPLVRGQGNHDALIRHVARQQEGNRNSALHWAACRAAVDGADGQVFAALIDASIATGLPAWEARRTVASARRAAAGVTG